MLKLHRAIKKPARNASRSDAGGEMVRLAYHKFATGVVPAFAKASAGRETGTKKVISGKIEP